MAKPGFLKVLEPIAGIAAAALAPEILPALAGGEAAAGAAEAAPFLIPGTDTALAAAESIPLGTLGADTAPFLIPGTDTPLVPGAETGLGGGQIPLGTLDTAGAGAAGVAGAVPQLGATAVGPAPQLGAAPGNLLGAEAPTAAVGGAPPLTSAPSVTGPVAPGIGSLSPASPLSAAADAPPAGTALPDLGLQGPPAGATVDTFLTDAGAGAGAGAGGYDAAISAGLPSDIGNIAGFGPADAAAAPGGGGLLAGAGDYAGKAGDYLLSHPGLPLTAGVAGLQLLKGNPQYPAAAKISGYTNPAAAAGAAYTGAGTAGLEGTAATTAGEAAALEAPLTTGILPPGLKQGVDAQTQAQKAQVRSNYASLGLTGSSMETDKLAQIDANAASQSAGIAEGLLPAAQDFSRQTLSAFNNLTSTGANLTGMSLNAYNALLSAQMKTDQNYQTALYNFARALSGSGYVAPTTNA